MPLEYARNGVVSMKTDVLSYGVLLLEIVSGKKNNSHNCFDYQLNLIGYVSFSHNSKYTYIHNFELTNILFTIGLVLGMAIME